MQNRSVTYIDTSHKNAEVQFRDCFYEYLSKRRGSYDSIIILCIGTDRATGDSFGPLIGHKLKDIQDSHIHVYGTLDKPVHAKNLAATLDVIKACHANPLLIAIDACLGKTEHIGYLTIGEGAIHPGAGVNKSLPSVGDIFITGIVNFSGVMDMLILQNTRLNLVMRMADIVSVGIKGTCGRLDIYDEGNIYILTNR